ncbi:MAG: hypothetical protein ACI4EN_10525 [Butyrivibrio sp.]
MKKYFTQGMAAILLAVMLITLNGTFVFGSYGKGTVKVPKNQIMTQAETGITRTGDYGFASVMAKSVYPVTTNTTDNYTKCLTRLYHNTIGNTPISDVYTLTENTSLERIYIKEGYLGQTKIDLCFAGNNAKYAAYIDYYYYGN